MYEEKIKGYIEDLSKPPQNEGILEFFFIVLSHFSAQWILILKGRNKVTFDLLLKALDHKNQEIAAYVADILGIIGNKQAVPFLKETLNRNDLWGVLACSVGGALIRLGDRTGADFLKELIINPGVHRDTRLDATKVLLRLKVKGVFRIDEDIDFGGESMTVEWSSVLRELVRKLRAQK